MTSFIICFSLGILFVLIKQTIKERRFKATKRRVAERFSLNESFISPEDISLIGLNFQDQTVILGSNGYEAEYRWNRIAAIEVLVNGTTIHQTNRGSQLASATIGGLLLGSVGAVIGGLSGSSRSSERIQGLSLKIIVDDQLRPTYSVTFFKAISKKGSAPKSRSVVKARGQLDRFHAHLVNAMKTAQSWPAQASQPSLAAEQTLRPELETECDLRYTLVLHSVNDKFAATDALTKVSKEPDAWKLIRILNSLPAVWKQDLSLEEATRMRTVLAVNGIVATLETNPNAIAQYLQKTTSSSSHNVKIGVVFIATLSCVTAVWIARTQPAPPPHPAPIIDGRTIPSPTADAIVVSATKLYRDYERNEISADAEYKGKKLLINGTVESIDKDFLDQPYLSLSTQNMFLGLRARLRQGEAAKAANLSKGDKVALLCVGKGMVIGSPTANDCIIR